MSIAAPSVHSLGAATITMVDGMEVSAQHSGAHEQARQFLQELEDGIHWQQTNKLALSSSMGSYHAPLFALCSEFRSGVHALRYATGDTNFPPRSSAVPQQTDALVARMRVILSSVDEIHANRPLGFWDGEGDASDHHERNGGGVDSGATASRGRIASLLSSFPRLSKFLS